MTTDRPRDLPMVDVVRLQEEACRRAGSMLYAQILAAIATDVEHRGPASRILAPWHENSLADAIPLRFLASVHRLVLSGTAPDLARFYPSAGGTDEGDPLPAFFEVVEANRATIESDMALGVQTNEVGRAASLVGAFHEVSHRTGLPLRMLEIGASAGLLLHWDRYGYGESPDDWGPGEGLRFPDPWVGPRPRFDPGLRVASRAGCDLHPIDVSTESGALALRAFLWPDQVERRRRLDAAIEVARRHHVRVVAADAGEWVEDQLAGATPGRATVVYHSIVLQYLPRTSFDRLRSAIIDAGKRADRDNPIAWIRMEPAGDVADIRMRLWPRGEDVVLGTTGYHGPPVEWTGG